MKKSKLISQEKLLEQGIEILLDRLGPVETNRFMSIPHKKQIESVKRYHQWQSKLEKESFFDEIFGSVGSSRLIPTPADCE